MTLSSTIRRIGKCLIFTFGAWLLAGPLALLQIGAWAWMLASYSQEGSIQTAVHDTFSGERPCGLCKIISEVENKEQETPARTRVTESKDLLLLPGHIRQACLFLPPGHRTKASVSPHFPKDPLLIEPGPPPRGFA